MGICRRRIWAFYGNRRRIWALYDKELRETNQTEFKIKNVKKYGVEQ